jgi:hypothetical protein
MRMKNRGMFTLKCSLKKEKKMKRKIKMEMMIMNMMMKMKDKLKNHQNLIELTPPLILVKLVLLYKSQKSLQGKLTNPIWKVECLKLMKLFRNLSRRARTKRKNCIMSMHVRTRDS